MCSKRYKDILSEYKLFASNKKLNFRLISDRKKIKKVLLKIPFDLQPEDFFEQLNFIIKTEQKTSEDRSDRWIKV